MGTSKPKMKKHRKHNVVYFLRKIGNGLTKQHEELPEYRRGKPKSVT